MAFVNQHQQHQHLEIFLSPDEDTRYYELVEKACEDFHPYNGQSWELVAQPHVENI